MPIYRLILLLAVLLAPATAHAQAPEASDEEVSDEEEAPPVRFSVSPIISAFYSPTHGIGVGFVVGVHNLGWTGSLVELSAEPMTRFGRYGVHFTTADPFEAPLYGMVGATYMVTSRFNFFGLGADSRRDAQIWTSVERVEAEARLGGRALGPDRVVLQPVVRLISTRLRDFEEAEPGAFDRLDAASQANLLRAAESATLGLTYGFEAVLDGTDRPEYPTLGALVQGSFRRYDGLGDDPARFWASTAHAYGFLPIGSATTVLHGRAVATVTRQIGERPVPFYEFPTLGDAMLGGYLPNRFAGPDLLALSAGVRFRVLDLFGLFGADGFVGAHAAAAYDDLFTQFEPSISFGRGEIGPGDNPPLRPALMVGGYLLNLRAERVLLTGQASVSPEGLQLGTLRFIYDFRSRHPGIR